MQASNRNLVALALLAALASPVVAQDKGASKGNKPTTSSATTAGKSTADPARPTSATATPTAAGTTTTATPTTPGTPATSTTPATSSTSTTSTTSTTPTTASTTTLGSGATGSRSGSNPGKGNWWTDADVDADGKLSTTEATANAGLNPRFTTVDVDRDGFVTQDEYRTFFAQNAGQGAANAAAHSMVVTRDTWLKLDADTDSRISVAEAASNAELSGAFLAIDGNKDGFVTQDEYRAYSKTR